MRKLSILLAGTALFTMINAPLAAQEVTLGFGFADFSSGLSDDGGMASAEYHHSPIYEDDRVSLKLGAVASVHFSGDIHLGVGIVGSYQLQNQWFLEGSVMPGAYFENEFQNGLGSTFEIRSLFALGRRFENGKAVSLALTHKSNASTAAYNPGVNSLLLRWHIPLGK